VPPVPVEASVPTEVELETPLKDSLLTAARSVVSSNVAVRFPDCEPLK
jgi:hypothetical protein